MKMRWRDLQNFSACIRARTLTEASVQLGISQPALTESIKRLEGECGLQLFYRSRNGIRLTPEGRDFSRGVETLITDWKNLEESFAGTTETGPKEIVFGCHRSIGTYLLPKVLKKLKLAQRKVDFRFVHDLSRNVQIQVQQGFIDFAVVINPAVVPDLVIKNIGIDYIRFWKKRGCDDDVLIYDPTLIQSQNLLRKLKDLPSRRVYSDSFAMTLKCIEEGIGYGLLPERFVKLSSKKLESPKNLPVFKDQVSLICRPEFAQSKLSKDLVKIITSELK